METSSVLSPVGEEMTARTGLIHEIQNNSSFGILSTIRKPKRRTFLNVTYQRQNVTELKQQTMSLFIYLFYFILFIYLYIYLLFCTMNQPTNAQLFHKLSHSFYMFRHYCVILRELVVCTLPSYIIMSNAVFGNILRIFNLFKPNDIYICCTAALTSRRYILNIYSTNIHTEYFKHAA